MKRICMATLFLIFALICSSCLVSNDHIIQEAKKCRDAGMDVVQTESGEIVCTPLKGK